MPFGGRPLYILWNPHWPYPAICLKWIKTSIPFLTARHIFWFLNLLLTRRIVTDK